MPQASDLRLRRSVLYMPGSNGRALEKARTLPADALILDLEDAVAPDAKEAARDAVCRAVSDGGYGDRELVIRVNALDTPWGAADLAAAVRARPDAILLPKVGSPATLAAAATRLDASAATTLWAMIETPAAISGVPAIAATEGARLACLVLGLNDLCKDTRTRLLPGRAALLPWMMTVLAAARAAGLAVLDGVYNDIADADGCRAECAQARDLGFDGKTLVHPTQLAPANAAFTPAAAEVRLARLVLAAFDRPENAARAAITVEDRLYEREHLDTARRTVAAAEAIAARDGARAAG